MSVKCPWQKNPFPVTKTWKNLNCKWFFHYRKWFCMRLLHLAPGPRTLYSPESEKQPAEQPNGNLLQK